MISKKYTYKEDPVSATEQVLYKLIATLMTIRKFQKISMPKLQVYLWGLKNDGNKQVLIQWKKSQKITGAPWMEENDVPQLITQCITNHYVRIETNKSGTVSYKLDYASTPVLQAVKGTDIERLITSDLDEIGKITDKALTNIEFDF